MNISHNINNAIYENFIRQNNKETVNSSSLIQESTFKPSMDDNKYPGTCKVQHEGGIQHFQVEKDVLKRPFFRDHI